MTIWRRSGGRATGHSADDEEGLALEQAIEDQIRALFPELFELDPSPEPGESGA